MQIELMKVETTKRYTQSTMWPEKQRHSKRCNILITEMERNCWYLTKPFGINRSAAETDQIKTQWTKEEVESMLKVDWYACENICKNEKQHAFCVLWSKWNKKNNNENFRQVFFSKWEERWHYALQPIIKSMWFIMCCFIFL